MSIKLDTDVETLGRLRESIIRDEDLALYARVSRGQKLAEDLVEIDKLLTKEEDVTKKAD